MTDDTRREGITRRDALKLLGAGATAMVWPAAAAAAPTFPPGAVIRTVLKDYAPDELAGAATLFHEHLSFAADFMTRWNASAADTRAVHALPGPFDTEVLAAMPADDAVATLRRVAPSRRVELLERLTPGRATELRELLAAHPGTAKGLMTTEVRTAPAGTAGSVLRSVLTARGPGAGAVRGGPSTVFELDGEGHPTGAVDAVDLLADPDPTPRRVPVLRADSSVDEVIRLFATHDLAAVPVVADDGRMIGAITIDDVLDELVAERLPGRNRFVHLLARHRRDAGTDRSRR